MTSHSVAIYGSGGHSQVVREILQACGHTVAFNFDDEPERRHATSTDVRPGMRLAGDLNFEPIQHRVLIAVGNNAERAFLAKNLKAKFITAIHPTAIISPTAKVGEGTVIHQGAVVQANSRIGSHVIINTAASVDHDNVIGDYAHISPQVALSGHVEVGEGTHIGSGACVIPSIRIGKWCTIGAGAVVIDDIPDFSTAVGNPARVIKRISLQDQRSRGEKPSFDLAFVGSGVATSFTLLNLIEHRADLRRPLNIAIIDRSGEFHTGIPYGARSGSTPLLISSLEAFLPAAERDSFYVWLSANKAWVFEEFRKSGGKLSQSWLHENRTAIEAGSWGQLYLPRRIFGKYLAERVGRALESARLDGYLKYELIADEVVTFARTSEGQVLGLKESAAPLRTKRTVLAIGGPAMTNRFNTDSDRFIDDPYEPSLRQNMNRIKECLERQDDRSDVLIVGANASAMEMIFQLNDDVEIDELVSKYLVISPRGELPHRLNGPTRTESTVRLTNLDRIALADDPAAEEVLAAATADCIELQALAVPISQSFGPIWQKLASVVARLSPEEKLVWANRCGNELGRHQRRAGPEYSSAVEHLLNEGRLELIQASFIDAAETNDGFVNTQIRTVSDVESKPLARKVGVVVNCAGGNRLTASGSPGLVSSMVQDETISLTDGKIGIKVNDELAAGPQLWVIGPFLAGNVIKGSPLWHVEHAGRISGYALELAGSINVDLTQDVRTQPGRTNSRG